MVDAVPATTVKLTTATWEIAPFVAVADAPIETDPARPPVTVSGRDAPRSGHGGEPADRASAGGLGEGHAEGAVRTGRHGVATGVLDGRSDHPGRAGGQAPRRAGEDDLGCRSVNGHRW